MNRDVCENRHGGNAESTAAWGKASISVEEWKAWILSELAIAKYEGRTCEELAESASRQLGRQIGQNVLSGRLTDLKREGQVTRSEITPRRKTASNCSAAVLVLPRYAKRTPGREIQGRLF